MRLERQKIILFLLCLLIAAYLSAAKSAEANAAEHRYHILAVKTRDIEFYNTVLHSFRHSLESRTGNAGMKVEVSEISLTGNADDDARSVRNQIQKGPELILTLGTNATRLVAEAHPTVPVLFSMVLDPVSLGVAVSLDVPGGKFTGTTLLISPGKQLDALLQAAPQVHKVGVLYTENDPTSTAFLTQARQEAQSLHLEIVAKAIAADKEADRAAVETLAGQVDAVWLIPDPASSGPHILADTLEVTRAKHLPILGASSATVRAGALLSLSANLQDLGEVSAEMAMPLLDGTADPSHMRIRGPRRTILSINLVAAKVLGVTIPDPVLHLADEVIDSDTLTK